MTLTKKKMVCEIGRRTRLTNKDVQEVVETLVDVWTEALIAGEKIEIENFIVLEVKLIDRGHNTGYLKNGSAQRKAPRYMNILTLRTSKYLKVRLQKIDN